MALQPAQDDFDSRTATFASWLRASGATVSPKIALKDFRHRTAGRGVVAQEDILEDTELFSIPRRIILSTSTSGVVSQLPDVFAGLDPWASLILVMIYEYNRGTDSPWKPYFGVLPETFDTLMFWTSDELAELQASAVVGKIGKESADEMFREQVVPVVFQHWDIFVGGKQEMYEEENVMELAHSMGSTIMAYAFDIESSGTKEVDEEGYMSDEEDEALPKGMVPLADMLNADADRNNARLFYEQNTLVMRSLKAIKAGEEIFNDYGPLPRSDLLRRYGYLTPNYAQYDVVELPQQLLIDACKAETGLTNQLVLERLDYLEEQDALDDGYDLARKAPDDPTSEISPELNVFISTLLLSDDNFAEMRRKGKLPKAKEVTPGVAKALVNAIRMRCSEYPTGLEEDLRIMHDEVFQGRKAMAVQVRYGEKVILEATLASLLGLARQNQDGNLQDEGPTKKRRMQ